MNVATSPAGSKPARDTAHIAGRRPVLTASPLLNALADSSMMTDARAIATAVQEAVDLLKDFIVEHNERSIINSVRAAGLVGNQLYYRELAERFLHDARGGIWSLEAFLNLFQCGLIEEPEDTLAGEPRRPL